MLRPKVNELEAGSGRSVLFSMLGLDEAEQPVAEEMRRLRDDLAACMARCRCRP